MKNGHLWHLRPYILGLFALLLSLTILPAQGIAQDYNDAYNPFADYSEFEETADEEADINFFRNGRFFTLGFIGGYRDFTSTMGTLQQPSFGYGLFLSYFFDLRIALQMSFLTGDHQFAFRRTTGDLVSGNVAFTDVAFNGKYYLNTQNVTRGLANINPYLIGGFSSVTRTTRVFGQTQFGKDSVMGFNVGAGIELPLMRNKMFVGAQGMYQLVTFADESSEIMFNTVEPTGLYNKGDIFTLLMVLGVNF